MQASQSQTDAEAMTTKEISALEGREGWILLNPSHRLVDEAATAATLKTINNHFNKFKKLVHGVESKQKGENKY